MSTEHGDGVGPISVARSFNALTDDDIIEFWKSNRSLTALRLLLGVVRRRDARQILRAIGEAHPNKEIPGRPWPRLSTSKKIVTAINLFFVEPMQHEQEAALRDVLRATTLWKEKAEIGLKFEALIAASDIEGVKKYIREMTELVDSITMAPPPVPPPKEKRSGREGLVPRGGVTGQVDPNTSESDLSESETEEGGRSGAS
jgi:hypothetical protein